MTLQVASLETSRRHLAIDVLSRAYMALVLEKPEFDRTHHPVCYLSCVHYGLPATADCFEQSIPKRMYRASTRTGRVMAKGMGQLDNFQSEVKSSFYPAPVTLNVYAEKLELFYALLTCAGLKKSGRENLERA